MANNDGYANEMSDPIDEPTRDENAAEALGSDATLASLAEAFSEPGDRVAAENLASSAVALQASLGRATTNSGLLGALTIWLGRGPAQVRMLLGRTGLRAGVGAIAAVMLMGGLAAAGALPSPIQDPVAEVAAVVGIDLPDSDEVDETRTETDNAEDNPEAPGDEVKREPGIDEPADTDEPPSQDDEADETAPDGDDLDEDPNDDSDDDNSGPGNSSDDDPDDDDSDEDDD
jgi:hypothetical protein